MKARTFTPKEFSAQLAEDFGIQLSATWVRQQCAIWLRSKGRKGIAVCLRARPYLIPASELGQFSAPHVFQRAVKVA